MLECPKCSFIPPNPNVRFCPNCGGKRIMDGEAPTKSKAQKGAKSNTGTEGRSLVLLVGGGLIALAVVYVGIFLILTGSGHAEPEISGTFRNAAGTPIYDIETWQPAGMHVNRYRELTGGMVTEATFGGWVFLPMVVMDRRWWHHSKSLVDLSKTGPEGISVRTNP